MFNNWSWIFCPTNTHQDLLSLGSFKLNDNVVSAALQLKYSQKEAEYPHQVEFITIFNWKRCKIVSWLQSAKCSSVFRYKFQNCECIMWRRLSYFDCHHFNSKNTLSSFVFQLLLNGYGRNKVLTTISVEDLHWIRIIIRLLVSAYEINQTDRSDKVWAYNGIDSTMSENLWGFITEWWRFTWIQEICIWCSEEENP